MSTLLEKARQLLAEGDLCDHCLGRAFSQLGKGLRNVQRGRALRTVLNMEGQLFPERESACRVCGGIFAQVPQWAQRAVAAVEGLEFRTYLMGTRVPPTIESAELALKEKHELRGEPFKQEFNREVGRLFGTILAERGRAVSVDFLDPEIVLLMDLEKSELTVRINSLFIYGRYKKFVRTIPQTKWPCRQCRGRGCPRCNFTGKTYQESVEELISPPLLRETRGVGTAFHGAGREDIDALMLGTGRPFVIEIKEPKVRTLDLARLQKEINESAAGKIEVSELQFVKGAVVERLKSLEAEKVYEAKVRFAEPITPEQLQDALTHLRGATIEQRTPTRVAHRRADLVRTRRVLEISGDLISSTEAVIRVHCEGGLYIKELVSGDGGRTRPSLSELLSTQAEVTELNVLEVRGDFLQDPSPLGEGSGERPKRG
jgi:tRNA pseudouridine synthase 10